MLRKIRVLAIAPYKELELILRRVASEYATLELNVVIGDLERGVEAAQANFHADYDVIVSRGGTARLLRERLSLPVVEIPITEYDILRALNFAEAIPGPVAMIGFPNVVISTEALARLLKIEINSFEVHHENEVADTVQTVWEQGYRLILCDMIASTIAKQLGLNAILITSGIESIRKAFDMVLELCRTLDNLQSENHFLRETINGQSNETVVFDENRNLYFSTISRENRKQVLEMLKSEIEYCTPDEPRRIVKSLGGVLYTIKCRQFSLLDRTYTTFYFSRSRAPVSVSRHAIRYYTKQEAQQSFYDGFFSVTGAVASLEPDISRLNASNRPIAILGEEGTGKEPVAFVLYARSELCSHPLVCINCALLNDRAWEYLQGHHNSPFAQTQTTIFISHLEALSAPMRLQLKALLSDMEVCRRNRVIFSCTCAFGEHISEAAADIIDSLCCLTLCLPPLREQRARIPALISLYINQLSVQQAKDILGMDGAGTKLMQDFLWPHNYTQLKRVLQDLVTMSAGSSVPQSDVRKILQLETSSPVATSALTLPERFDLNRTLAEMEDEIIRRVIEECGGNQSAAAKRLGISRSAIWRHLKK
ncbi:MAG: PrpR N-terminal domain-containing protein [Eubacteriales bacterium]|nr:PrpR N-terminal domain-containing protein [Eubacteriales bacterium]